MEFQENQNGYPPLKPNKGKLFKNKNKVAGDSQPDYSGPFCDERGDEAQVKMWINTAKSGDKYMNIEIAEKWQPDQQQQPQQQQSAPTPPPMPAEMAQAFDEDWLGDNGSK